MSAAMPLMTDNNKKKNARRFLIDYTSSIQQSTITMTDATWSFPDNRWSPLDFQNPSTARAHQLPEPINFPWFINC
jgi:hypothetical protein